MGPAPFQTENDPFHGAPPNLEDFGISGKKSANLILVTLKLLIVLCSISVASIICIFYLLFQETVANLQQSLTAAVARKKKMVMMIPEKTMFMANSNAIKNLQTKDQKEIPNINVLYHRVYHVEMRP